MVGSCIGRAKGCDDGVNVVQRVPDAVRGRMTLDSRLNDLRDALALFLAHPYRNDRGCVEGLDRIPTLGQRGTGAVRKDFSEKPSLSA
jgi:hypothetical protein